VGSRNDRAVRELLDTVVRCFIPFKTLISLDADSGECFSRRGSSSIPLVVADAWLLEQSPYLRSLVEASSNRVTVHVCDNYACSLPLHTMEELKQRLQSLH
jgi:uncharacterized protein YyaL (SSP411 family)